MIRIRGRGHFITFKVAPPSAGGRQQANPLSGARSRIRRTLDYRTTSTHGVQHLRCCYSLTKRSLTVKTGKTGKLPAGSPGHVTAVGDIGRAALSTTPQPRSSAALFTFLDEEHAERPDMNANGLTNGVGMGCKPTVYLRPGQTVRLSVKGLGERQQRAVADPR